jgi:hypothetical protein
MIDRLTIVTTTALLILWQSGCLTIDNGMLVNRCGLWQLFTSKPMIVSLGDVQERVVDRIVERVIPSSVPAASGSQSATMCASMPTTWTTSTPMMTASTGTTATISITTGSSTSGTLIYNSGTSCSTGQ